MLKKFYATKDAQITNARRVSLFSSGSLSNMGLADTGEIFSIWNQSGFNTGTESNDVSRILINFDIDSILSDAEIPTGTSKFYLRMFNVAHDKTLPTASRLVVYPMTVSWDEGYGLDMENYQDLGAVNWLSSSQDNSWGTPGGDYNINYEYGQTFEKGTEDLEIDLTNLMSVYRSGTLANKGLMLRLTGSQEFQSRTLYTKRFSLRGTEFFYSRPCLEARWNDAYFDDRNNSYLSSNLASVDDNLNTIYLYNRIRGRLVNIPNIEFDSVYVSFNSSSATGTSDPVAYTTATWFMTGVYAAQFSSSYTGTLTDVWHDNAGTIFYTSSINLKSFLDDYYDDNDEFVLSMPNLKSFYNTDDKPRLDLFIRKRNWKSNIYTVASSVQENEYIKKAYYRIERAMDKKEIVPFGTGSVEYTKLSYDSNGNFFILPMNIFEPNYQYEISYIFDIDGKKTLQKERFKFRVDQ